MNNEKGSLKCEPKTPYSVSIACKLQVIRRVKRLCQRFREYSGGMSYVAYLFLWIPYDFVEWVIDAYTIKPTKMLNE